MQERGCLIGRRAAKDNGGMGGLRKRVVRGSGGGRGPGNTCLLLLKTMHVRGGRWG